MDIFALLLGLAVVGTTAYLVASPLISPTLVEGEEADLDEVEAIEKEKESVFTTLGEIEFDYRMNKLSADDYQSLQTTYKRQAVAVLKSEEDLAPGSRVDEDGLEAEVTREVEAEIEAELAAEVERRKG